jgi:protein SCO1
MKKQMLLIFLLISTVGFMAIHWLWPKGEDLPILDKVKSFQLEDVHGDLYKSSNNKIKLVAYFYTNCPDICPLTMMDFRILQDKLKKAGLFGEEVELVAVTLDPDHDTKEVISKYAESFEADSAGWKWLRGTKEQIKVVADDFQMQYQKLEGDYYSHSVTMYLIDPKNQVRALYDMANPNKPVDKDKILADIQLLTS